MGFYLRKSVRLGPLRFNLSSSGIGVSSGIPGFRVGMGPRGTYIHMGRSGLYYRQTLSSRSRPGRSEPVKFNSPQVSAGTHGPMRFIGSECVSKMVDSSSAELLSAIERKRRQWSLFPIAAILCLIAIVASAATSMPRPATIVFCVIGTLLSIVARQVDVLRKSIVLMYDLDEVAENSFTSIIESIDDLSNCGGLWCVSGSGNVLNTKYHAGANTLVARNKAKVQYHDPPFLTSNLSIPRITLGTKSLYFFPDRMLMYAPNGVGAVSYDAVRLSVDHTNFVEDGSVPQDAKIVGHTWQYVNKGGGPDRRFASNRQLSICSYEELHLTSPTGLREVLHVSRHGIGQKLKSGMEAMALAIAAAQLAEQERIRMIEVQKLQEIRQSVQHPTPSPQAVSLDGLASVHEAMFEILCCIMLVDGRIASVEKNTVRSLMEKVKAPWSSEHFDRLIANFVHRVRSDGFKVTWNRVSEQLSLFKSGKRQRILLASIDAMLRSEQIVSANTQKFADHIRRSLIGGEGHASV